MKCKPRSSSPSSSFCTLWLPHDLSTSSGKAVLPLSSRAAPSVEDKRGYCWSNSHVQAEDVTSPWVWTASTFQVWNRKGKIAKSVVYLRSSCCEKTSHSRLSWSRWPASHLSSCKCLKLFRLSWPLSQDWLIPRSQSLWSWQPLVLCTHSWAETHLVASCWCFCWL